MDFAKWCTTDRVSVKGHDLHVLTAVDSKLNVGRDVVAAVVPGHYASEQRVADILKRLGKAKAAEYIQQKLPKSKSIRSGDLGEILGASYVAELMPYDVTVNKLRWKDHRKMAMRGEDIIAVHERMGLTIGVCPSQQGENRKQDDMRDIVEFTLGAARVFDLG